MLWLGTDGGGLDKFDPESETFVHYTAKDGLPGDGIRGILEEDAAPGDGPGDGGGVLWVSTNNGLSRFDPRTETFRNFDASDGLQGNEFMGRACHKSSSGEMFFGGMNGFTAFYPDRVRDNPHVPPVVLTSLRQNGEDVGLRTALEHTEKVAFHWPDNSFEFEFAALNYIQPSKNQYAYRLEGFDRDWNHVGNRPYGKYTNLPGGTYTLRLKGSNNDGVWNEEGSSLAITIVPPFWATWWFRGIAILALVGVAACLIMDSSGANCKEVRIALGAVATSPIRAAAAEEVLQGNVLSEDFIEEAAVNAKEAAEPITDVRGSADYRSDLVQSLTRDALRQIKDFVSS